MADAVRHMLKILGAVPIGLIVVWVRRPTWEHRRARARVGAEERRKEQAWREWRGH